MSKRQVSSNKSTKSGSRPGPGQNQAQRGKQAKRGKPTLKSNALRFDMMPQKKSIRSNTGASYSDGFHAVSKPERGMVRVEEFDEFVATVMGQTAFTITQFACNPGQSLVFPRLSKFAVLYEKYRFRRLEFYFQHDVSQFNAQGAAGLVILSGLYDAASAIPTTKAQVEVTEPHVICMPNENSLLRFNPNRLHPIGMPLYVRPGNLPGGADIKTYDAANVFVTVQGMAGAGEVGELHVRGSVELIGDILDSSSLSAPINNQVADFASSAPESLTTTVPLQLLVATAINNGLNAVNTAGSIVLPAGNYLLLYEGLFSFGGSGTSASVQLQKNGANVGTAFSTNFVAAQVTTTTASASRFVQSNGTDAFTLLATATFSTSTCTCSGIMNFVAV